MAKRRAVLADARSSQRVVLECNDLCAFIFSHLTSRDKLTKLALVSRQWKRCVYTAPGAWCGRIIFEDHVPRDLRWLTATRNALLFVPYGIDATDLKRVLDNGTNPISMILREENRELWMPRRAMRRSSAHVGDRLTHAHVDYWTDPRMRKVPESVVSLNVNSQGLDRLELPPRLRELQITHVCRRDADIIRTLALTSIEIDTLDAVEVPTIDFLPKTLTHLTLRQFDQTDLADIVKHLPGLRSLALGHYVDFYSVRLAPLVALKEFETLELSRVCIKDPAVLVHTRLKHLKMLYCEQTEPMPVIPTLRSLTTVHDNVAALGARRPNVITRVIW